MADLLPWKRASLSSSSHRFEIGESSAAVATRQHGSTLAQGTRDRLVVSLEETNERVSELDASYRHDSHKIYVRLKDAQDDRVVLQAQLASSRREAQYLRTRVITVEQESAYTRDA
ncbi:hypothetical protein Tco_1288004 [Tanacetum coccineum]